MSNFLKIVISFLLMTLISIVSIFIIFYSKIDLKFLKFINTNLELKYQDELNNISDLIENSLNNKQEKIEKYIKSFDFTKFQDKSKSKSISFITELQEFNKLRESEKEQLTKIKFIDLSKNTVFSTDDNEKELRNNFVSFKSLDRIEDTENFFEETDKLKFIFKDKSFIFKKSVSVDNKIAGVMLFYFKDTIFNEILLNNEIFIFKNIFFINNKTIFVNKPDVLPEDKLKNIDLNEDKIKIITLSSSLTTDDENILERKYRIFPKKILPFDLSVVLAVENKYFDFDKTKKIVIVFLFFYTLYLLFLVIFSFRKSQLERAKEKLSLFTTVLIEEMLNAKTKEEFDKIRLNLEDRKNKVLKTLSLDFKKLKNDDKKGLEEQLDTVLKRVENSFEKKYENSSDNQNIEKLEKLFEKFISTISEKGIALNVGSSIKVLNENESTKKDNKAKVVKVKQVKEVEDAEEIEELEELEDADEVEDIGEVEEAEDVENLEDIDENEVSEELEELEDAEEIDEVEEVEEAEEIQENEEIEEVREVEDIEEVEEAEDVENLEDIGKNEVSEELVESDEADEEEQIEESDTEKVDVNKDPENIEVAEIKVEEDEIDDIIEIGEDIQQKYEKDKTEEVEQVTIDKIDVIEPETEGVIETDEVINDDEIKESVIEDVVEEEILEAAEEVIGNEISQPIEVVETEELNGIEEAVEEVVETVHEIVEVEEPVETIDEIDSEKDEELIEKPEEVIESEISKPIEDVETEEVIRDEELIEDSIDKIDVIEPDTDTDEVIEPVFEMKLENDEDSINEGTIVTIDGKIFVQENIVEEEILQESETEEVIETDEVMNEDAIKESIIEDVVDEEILEAPEEMIENEISETIEDVEIEEVIEDEEVELNDEIVEVEEPVDTIDEIDSEKDEEEILQESEEVDPSEVIENEELIEEPIDKIDGVESNELDLEDMFDNRETFEIIRPKAKHFFDTEKKSDSDKNDIDDESDDIEELSEVNEDDVQYIDDTDDVENIDDLDEYETLNNLEEVEEIKETEDIPQQNVENENIIINDNQENYGEENMNDMITDLYDFPKIEVEFEEIYVEKDDKKEIEKIEDLFGNENENHLVEDENDKDTDDVPKIPYDFYNVNEINDDLRKDIIQIEERKTNLQILLEQICNSTNGNK
ncbi:MAG TPA: hypothetical protein PK771_07875, partial [Spirochaetota bacterium]|nr:hypothetical protein [Spirochaetota bacterium]